MTTSNRLPLLVLILSGLAALGSHVTASAAEVAFAKQVIDPLFRSEGVGVGDVNKDGKNDILVGDFWYEAPDWKPHEIRKPRQPNRGGYTEAFAVYPDDFNRDGWVDVLVVPFHGKDAKWYENPRNKDDGHWKERVAFKRTGNETRLYTDQLFDDGPKAFLMGIEERMLGWVAVPEDPNEEWEVHDITGPSGKAAAHRFAHGLGVGDVNGDGRKDVMYKDGWWEQPAEGHKHTEPWKFHNTKIVNDNVADMYTFDADGDGDNDILCTSAHAKGIYFCEQVIEGDKSSFKTHALERIIHETHSLNYVDVNGDGRKDLLTGRGFFAHGFKPELAREPSELYWYELETAKGQPPKLKAHKIDDQSGVGAQFVSSDFNGDKKIDVVISNRKGVFLFLQE